MYTLCLKNTPLIYHLKAVSADRFKHSFIICAINAFAAQLWTTSLQLGVIIEQTCYFIKAYLHFVD